MKKLLVIVFFLLSLFSLCSAYFQLMSEETDQFRRTITNHSQSVIFSEENIIGASEHRKKEIVTEISNLSKEHQVNVYKYDSHNQSKTSEFYAKLNFNSEIIYKGLQMAMPEDTENYAVENKNTLSSNNKYLLKDFNQLAYSEILSGRYIIQYQDKRDVLAFCEDLQQKLDIQIEINSDNSDSPKNKLFFVINLVIIATLIFIILFSYYLNYKNNTIKSYFGYTDLQLIHDIFFIFAPAFFLSIIIALGLGIFLFFQKILFLTVLRLLIVFMWNNFLIGFISYVLIVVFIKFSKKDWLSLKGKKPLKKALVLGILFIYTIVPFIAGGLSEVVPLTQSNLKLIMYQKRNQKILKNYVYLPLLSAGVSTDNEQELVRSFQNHTELLAKFYEEGLLLFRMTDATRHRLNGEEYQDDFGANELWVSPSYLKHSFVEIHDLSGNKVDLDNSEKNMIILVPEKYKKNIDELKKYYSESHDFYDFQVAQEFSSEKLEKKTSDIEFIFIEDHSKLLFFKETEMKLNNPIIRVITPNNVQKETSVYADDILGQTDYFYVKNDGNLKKIVERYDVYSEFPVQIDAYNYLMNMVNEDLQLIEILIVIIGSFISLYLIISYVLSNVFVTMNMKSLKLNILFGVQIKKIFILYYSATIIPWLSVFFFHPTNSHLVVILMIVLSSVLVSFFNFFKVYKNISMLE